MEGKKTIILEFGTAPVSTVKTARKKNYWNSSMKCTPIPFIFTV